MSSAPYQYDAFISYRRQEPDKSAARVLLQALQAEGYRVAFDEVDFAPHKTFLAEMDRCVTEKCIRQGVGEKCRTCNSIAGRGRVVEIHIGPETGVFRSDDNPDIPR